MTNELIINFNSSEEVIALLRDKRLIELHHEKTDNNFSVGDIYLGTVKKIMPGLNAAFVDVGHEKDAFLHYLDLGPQVKSLNTFTRIAQQGGATSGNLASFKIEPPIVKTGKIGDVLNKGNQILVQIVKEPISTKGPRISTEMSLAGRYMILVPFSNSISVSKKIGSVKERTRLKNLAQSIKPQNFGVIIRTVAEERSVEDLHKDLLNLMEKWELVFQKTRTAQPRQRILGELSRTSSILRDILNENFNNIVVNDAREYEELKSYVKTISPEMANIVRLYEGKQSIFDYYGVNKQIKSSFGKTVSLQGGAYLVIEHTEALHVIDVNSGSKTNSQNNQEENALNVNIEAAKEIARQLRLRDMGGIIVVDFIDLKSQANRKIVLDELSKEMKTDRAKHNILPMSKFGLMQITRQRVRPEMNIVTAEVCPMCKGSGQIAASILLMDELESNLLYVTQSLNIKRLTLLTHPYIEAFINRGIISLKIKWFFKHNAWVTVKPDNSYHLSEYHFFNPQGEEIKL